MRAAVRYGALIVASALALAACGSSTKTTAPATTTSVPSAPLSTSWGGQCGSAENAVHQSLNGDISGCFRVPALNSTSLVVGLQTYFSPSSKHLPSPTTTTMSTPPVEGQLTLSVTSRSVTPGETVVVTGRYAGQRPAGQSGYANLCWDGCQTGLQEQGVTLHWVSSTTPSAA